MSLSLDQELHFAVAQGFLGLQMHLDADAALDDIDRSSRDLPEVLEVRLNIYQGLKRWDLMEAVAKTLVKHEPENVARWLSWAYATRRAGSIETARLILLKALKQDFDHGIIHYNLACYECQLGKLDGARDSLKKCFELDPDWKLDAWEEEDLAPLRDSL